MVLFLTGEKEKSGTVLDTFTRTAELIYTITYSNGEKIETTWNHPFWIVANKTELERGPPTVNQNIGVSLFGGIEPRKESLNNTYANGKWKQAKDIKIGDFSKLANGKSLLITNIQTEHRHENVYNFTVDTNSTYYVGNDGVLVHNGNLCSALKHEIANFIQGVKNYPDQFKKGSKELANDLKNVAVKAKDKAIQHAEDYGEALTDEITKDAKCITNPGICSKQLGNQLYEALSEGELNKKIPERNKEGFLGTVPLILNSPKMALNVGKGYVKDTFCSSGLCGGDAQARANYSLAKDTALGYAGAFAYRGLKALGKTPNVKIDISNLPKNLVDKAKATDDFKDIGKGVGDGIDNFAGNISKKLNPNIKDALSDWKFGKNQITWNEYLTHITNKFNVPFDKKISDVVESGVYKGLSKDHAEAIFS